MKNEGTSTLFIFLDISVNPKTQCSSVQNSKWMVKNMEMIQKISSFFTVFLFKM